MKRIAIVYLILLTLSLLLLSSCSKSAQPAEEQILPGDEDAAIDYRKPEKCLP